jgi:hypothetical protein
MDKKHLFERMENARTGEPIDEGAGHGSGMMGSRFSMKRCKQCDYVGVFDKKDKAPKCAKCGSSDVKYAKESIEPRRTGEITEAKPHELKVGDRVKADEDWLYRNVGGRLDGKLRGKVVEVPHKDHYQGPSSGVKVKWDIDALNSPDKGASLKAGTLGDGWTPMYAVIKESVDEGEVIRGVNFGGKKEEPKAPKVPSYEEMKRKCTWLGKVITPKSGSKKFLVVSAHMFGWRDNEKGSIQYRAFALSGGDAGSEANTHDYNQNYKLAQSQDIVFTGKNARRRKARIEGELTHKEAPHVYDAGGSVGKHIVANVVMDKRSMSIGESLEEMSDKIRRERIAALTQAIKDKKDKGDPWEAEKEELLQLRKEVQTESDEDKNIDAKMFAKGYRHKLSPQSKKFEPLYVKTAMDAGPVMRDYPDERFDVTALEAVAEKCTHQPRESDGKFGSGEGTGQIMADSEDEKGLSFMNDPDQKDRVKDAKGLDESDGYDMSKKKAFDSKAAAEAHVTQLRKGYWPWDAEIFKDSGTGKWYIMAVSDEDGPLGIEEAAESPEDEIDRIQGNLDRFKDGGISDKGRKDMQARIDHLKSKQESGLPPGEYYAQKGKTHPADKKKSGLKPQKAASKVEEADDDESNANDDLDIDGDGVTKGVVADGDEESQMEPIAPKLENEGDWCRELIRQIGTGVRMNIGMRDMVKDDAKRKLHFRVGGGQMKKMVITLRNDLYDIEGWKGRNFRKVKEFKGIYADQLGEILIKMNSILHGHNESAETRQRNHLFEALDCNSRPEIEE